ncbi:HEAT domain containing protein [Alkaliphilus metalliredigens QYMF]|uniref:HEAT domain containing protein n=1 Tax=Alkaliphilus metalliredigens (strain QYMF) TaxID=293826 RepID=A6TN72_ALKMQ|nr:DNA alkylation repair protein [Alkaliphilus metalliredigens]ABR47640.1 HEAT domain containing protein [Alkaliphilus metalliredigens QYMF]
MAELLKNLYSKTFIESFSVSLEQTLSKFDRESFVNDVMSDDWDEKELKQRMKHIAVVLKTYLHNDYEKDIQTIILIINQIRKSGLKEESIEYMFFPEFIERYGLDYFDISINAIEEITQFTSCEFAIRPFIKKYPEKTMSVMLDWSYHSNHLVRRLSSEGCRPRLPWAMALPDFKLNPQPILPILENLKNDTSEFVRRSVANNLNDIAKDHPNIVIEISKMWKGDNKETDWIVKHGCRTLLKQANHEALKLFGFENGVNCKITKFEIHSDAIKIGDNLEFSFELMNDTDKELKLRIEYGIYYMKANGKWNRKLFKITENTYKNNATYTFKRKQSFRNLTTRKHYLGDHKIAYSFQS